MQVKKGARVPSLRSHIFAAGLAIFALLLGGETALFNFVLDVRSTLFSRPATGDIAVVAIDAASIEKSGTWPWPRSLHAELIRKLQSAGAEDIAFDVDFSSPSAWDDEFEASLKASGAVILPTFRQATSRDVRLTEPLPRFRDSTWTALVNVTPDKDGIVRQYPFGESIERRLLPSMATLLAGSENLVGSFYVDFSIDRRSIPVFSYADVIAEVPEVIARLRGRKVIVGATALELGDRLNVPGQILAGPFLQALAADSIHQKRALTRTSEASAWALALFVIIAMGFLWRRMTGGRRAALLVTAVVAVEGLSVLLQWQWPLIVDTAPFLIVAAAYLVALTFDEINLRGMLRAVSENRFRKVAMSLGDALVCADEAGRIVMSNPAAEAMFGYKTGAMVGESVASLLGRTEDGSFSLSTHPDTEEFEAYTSDRRAFPVEVRVSSWNANGSRQYGVIIRDISARKREAEKIRRLAERDSLTDLANRYTLRAHIDAKIKESGAHLALLLLDLDRFKEFNDTMGHSFGDKVILAMSQRLVSVAGPEDMVGRLGGDEFAVVLVGETCLERAKSICSQIEAFAHVPVDVLGRLIDVRFTVGAALYPQDAATTDELFANADLALYQAKASVRGRSLFFQRNHRIEFECKLSLEAELHRAIREEEFELFYQPQIDLHTSKITGAEALIRWRHPQRGLIAPGEFLPVLNQSPLAFEVGDWVLRTACRQAAAWRASGRQIRVGVNLSPSQLQSADLRRSVSSALETSGLPPALLELEVTEDNVLANETQALAAIISLQELGVRTAFDDFGTGYASLSHLKKFPLDVLKIDQTFVMDLQTSPDDMAIVQAIIGLGQQFGLSIIAEGVENATVAAHLKLLGCQEAQGYHFGRPMSANDFSVLLDGEQAKTAA
jgi:diguanylate cyclase (GGDEF)-like protein/PAS domain S-box-containing protein